MIHKASICGSFAGANPRNEEDQLAERLRGDGAVLEYEVSLFVTEYDGARRNPKTPNVDPSSMTPNPSWTCSTPKRLFQAIR